MSLMLPATSALVAVDLQNGVVGLPLAPHRGSDVVERTARLAVAFRSAGLPVVLVRVAHEPDGGSALAPEADAPFPPPVVDAEADALVDALTGHPTDLVVTKRQWGAFHGTELDLQLRRRGVTHVVLTGIATNLGVESTARQAFEHGYTTILVADATSALSAEEHEHPLRTVFPRIGRVVTTNAVLGALS